MLGGPLSRPPFRDAEVAAKLRAATGGRAALSRVEGKGRCGVAARRLRAGEGHVLIVREELLCAPAPTLRMSAPPHAPSLCIACGAPLRGVAPHAQLVAELFAQLSAAGQCRSAHPLGARTRQLHLLIRFVNGYALQARRCCSDAGYAAVCAAFGADAAAGLCLGDVARLYETYGDAAADHAAAARAVSYPASLRER
eukprot:gene25759-1490_t